MSDRFIKYIPSEKAAWLRQHYTALYLLLSLAAERARYHDDILDGLLAGDAILGSYEEAGISRQQYRDAIDKGVELGIWDIVYHPKYKKFPEMQKRTIKRTIKTIVVNIKDSSIWDLNLDNKNHQKNQQGTIREPQTKNEKNEEEVFYKKETKKEKSVRSSFRSLKATPLSFDDEKKDSFDVLMNFNKEKEWHIQEEDILKWIQIYGSERIIEEFLRLNKSKTPIRTTPTKCIQSALYRNYPRQEEMIAANKSFAIEFKDEKNWQKLKINQQYCTDTETGDDYQFKLPDFQEILKRKFNQKLESNTG